MYCTHDHPQALLLLGPKEIWTNPLFLQFELACIHRGVMDSCVSHTYKHIICSFFSSIWAQTWITQHCQIYQASVGRGKASMNEIQKMPWELWSYGVHKRILYAFYSNARTQHFLRSKRVTCKTPTWARWRLKSHHFNWIWGWIQFHQDCSCQEEKL